MNQKPVDIGWAATITVIQLNQASGLAVKMKRQRPEGGNRVAAEQRHLLGRALASLGGRCRSLLDALFLREVEGYERVVDELDIPVGSIGPTRRRCLDRLLEALRALGFPLDEDVSGKDPAASDEVKAARRRSSR